MDVDISQLTRRLGSGRVRTGPSIAPRYRTDAFREHRGSPLADRGELPAAVVLPRTTEEVVAAVRWASQAGVKIVPWGGGTGLMGGARSSSDSVVLDL
ncbi:MAG: FAD-binding oxidoreductase, partial [Methanobacteriota archaeon]